MPPARRRRAHFNFQDTRLNGNCKEDDDQNAGQEGCPRIKSHEDRRTREKGDQGGGAATAAATVKPIKTAFNKTSLMTHLAEMAAVEIKAVKAVIASLEATILASVHKKGLGSFTLPGQHQVLCERAPMCSRIGVPGEAHELGGGRRQREAQSSAIVEEVALHGLLHQSDGTHGRLPGHGIDIAPSRPKSTLA